MGCGDQTAHALCGMVVRGGMKIQTTEAQVWWIAIADEIRPREGVPLPRWAQALQKKFNFVLVSLVDWLADRVLDAMAEAAAIVSFAPYVSPLASRIEAIRAKIFKEANAHGWPIAKSQLDDRHIVRRMVLKRVVYGVDKNPMAVELAKVSLWLHSFTVGAPLSFLDHHLRCGDSVIGAWARPTVDRLKARGALFSAGAIASVEQVASVMESIEDKTDSDITEVAASKTAFGVVEDTTKPMAAFFSLLTAERMMGVLDGASKKAPPASEKMAGKSDKQLSTWRQQVRAFEAASSFGLALEGAFGDPVKIASGETRIAPPELVEQLSLLPANESDPQSSLFPKNSIDDRRRVLADHLVADASTRAAEHRFFHWEIGFPNVWSNLLSAEHQGGFDAVIGNPPYVRQELLGDEMKRVLKADYAAFDGMADLYVYFYEQGLRLLRPGGRLSYVVTNKWLKVGYAEAPRGLFASNGQVEFVADFGHAKHFFPDADVFPSVVVVRKPVQGEAVLVDTQVCVIPRDAVPEKGLSAAVVAATYPLPRAHFTKESWTLEPPAVVALLDKIKKNGVPLIEYAGVKPYRGVTTGFNDAFFIDTPTRDRLVRDDPNCAAIIKRYLRGQDIDRWNASWKGLWMIFARRGIEIDRYPSVKRHLEQFRRELTPKPEDWKPENPDQKWPGRKEGSYAWFEIQDSVEYWADFDKPKIIYQAIQYYASYACDAKGFLLSNKAFFLPVADTTILAALNSPLGWWVSWRHFLHMKDEALSNDGVKIVNFPITTNLQLNKDQIEAATSDIASPIQTVGTSTDSILTWLQHEFGLQKAGRSLTEAYQLDADGFVTAVCAALPKSKKWSAAEIARLKQEYADTVVPAGNAAAQILALERKLCDLVNAAYGLTRQEVALMWRTAPPRMPLDPAEELRRLGIEA
jgi:Eco57I restriction-modification methylase/TaqI-like C-terminal specificity domain